MALVLEYMLLMDRKDYAYTGSGKVRVFGSANVVLETNIVYASLGFFDNEYAYDDQHNIWKIVKLTGEVDNYVWTAINADKTQEFATNELFSFEAAPPYFTAKYLNLIQEYSTLANNILQKLNDLGVSQYDIPNASDDFKLLLDMINRMNYRADVVASYNQSNNTFSFKFADQEFIVGMPILMMMAKSLGQSRKEKNSKLAFKKAKKLLGR